MDFLRRLAPLRDTDRTSAVAVLPSRFAHEGLAWADRAPLVSVPPAIDDGTALPRPQRRGALTPDPRAASAHSVASDAAAAPVARPARIAAPPTAAAPAPDESRPPAVAARRGPGDRPGATAAEAGSPAVTAWPERPAARPAPTAEMPHAASREPLSAATVALRTQPARDEGRVVQVTIGRIDVVASPPAPGPHRGAKAPRPAPVSLADYLRAGHEGRR